MPVIAIAESLAFALGQPVEISPDLRVIRGEGFQIDFCEGGTSVITQKDILPVMVAVLGESRVIRPPVLGVGECVFPIAPPLISPPPGSVVRERLSNGWMRLKAGLEKGFDSGKLPRLFAA